MNWSEDTDFRIILTNKAELQAQKILDYIFYELKNVQAAFSVEQDMKETIARLSHTARSLKLCDDPTLSALGYRTIHLKNGTDILCCIRLLMTVYMLLVFIMTCKTMKILLNKR